MRSLLGIGRVIQEFADFSRLKVLYLSHEGTHFSLGGHRRFFAEQLEQGNLAAIVQIAEDYKEFLSVIAALPCLTAGVAYGSAQGGGFELLLALDFQLVWPGVKLGCPEISSGLIAGMGGISYLGSVAGFQTAMRMNIHGELIESEEAHRLGLVSHLAENPFQDALDLAKRLPDHNAAQKIRAVLNRTKYELLRADIDCWVSFVCNGEWTQKKGKILEDFEMIEK
jgi:enoyl-CoA hydratase/carnithine racemase